MVRKSLGRSILTLSSITKLHGKPEHIRLDKGAEFTASRVVK
jgi:hypothetical protein